MQTCFFAISGVLPRDEAIEQIKKSIKKTYGKRGEAVVQRNFRSSRSHPSQSSEVPVPAKSPAIFQIEGASVSKKHLNLYKMFLVQCWLLKEIMSRSVLLPHDGTFPTATSQWEKRNISLEIPVWDPDICIQCGKCVFVCPHAVIRMKVYDDYCTWNNAPETFKSIDAKFQGCSRK